MGVEPDVLTGDELEDFGHGLFGYSPALGAFGDGEAVEFVLVLTGFFVRYGANYFVALFD